MAAIMIQLQGLTPPIRGVIKNA